MGAEGEAFYSRQDAGDFLNLSFKDYEPIDVESLNLPICPGTVFYFCYFDMWADWEISEEYCSNILFDEDGTVRIENGLDEYIVIGENADPCFKTLPKARKFVEEKEGT